MSWLGNMIRGNLVAMKRVSCGNRGFEAQEPMGDERA